MAKVKVSKEMEEQLDLSEAFGQELLNVLEKSPELRKAWGRLKFSVLDPTDVKDQLMECFLIAYEEASE